MYSQRGRDSANQKSPSNRANRTHSHNGKLCGYNSHHPFCLWVRHIVGTDGFLRNVSTHVTSAMSLFCSMGSKKKSSFQFRSVTSIAPDRKTDQRAKDLCSGSKSSCCIPFSKLTRKSEIKEEYTPGKWFLDKKRNHLLSRRIHSLALDTSECLCLSAESVEQKSHYTSQNIC